MTTSLHPVLTRLCATYRDAGRPNLSSGSPDDARALIASGRAFLGAGPADVQARAVTVPTRGGSVPARLLLPGADGASVGGVLVYLHGGGWVVGALDDYDALGRHLARRSGCAVLMLDYRLAPEHPFPAGLHDVEDALRFVAANGLGLTRAGALPLPLAVGGDSAGGNLATVAAATLRGEIALVLQLLIYPATDSRMAHASYAEFGALPFLTRGDMAWFYGHYAPQPLWSDPRISPANGRLEGLPPVWLGVAEHDVLHDEGLAYAHQLTAAGVSVQLQRYEGVTHGFARLMHHLDTADRMVDDAAAAIRHACSAGAMELTVR